MSAPISLNIESTETGSVAEMRELKAIDSQKENIGRYILESAYKYLREQNIIVEVIMAMKVPRKEYMKIDPMLLKNTHS